MSPYLADKCLCSFRESDCKADPRQEGPAECAQRLGEQQLGKQAQSGLGTHKKKEALALKILHLAHTFSLCRISEHVDSHGIWTSNMVIFHISLHLVGHLLENILILV